MRCENGNCEEYNSHGGRCLGGCARAASPASPACSIAPWISVDDDGQSQGDKRMAMTKPAGVFLQIISIPIMLFGCVDGMADINRDESGMFGWAVFGLGLLMLWAGGRPARKQT